MSRLKNLHLLLSFSALAALSATTAMAQGPDSNPSNNSDNSASYTQSQPAPIERAAPQQPAYGRNYVSGGRMRRPAPPAVKESSPAPGIILHVSANGTVQTVSSTSDNVELRVEHGKANVTVHDVKQNTQILVDLPGGQVDLFKDGLYTFNADTNTVSVLVGEAKAYPASSTGANKGEKGINLKEDHQLVFAGAKIHAVDVGPYQVRADLLPGSFRHGDGFRGGYPAYGDGFGDGPYGDGFAYGGYPYYGWGGPYDGFGWGYPFGIGFGYGGGFGFGGGYGGFRGGYGGFRGRR
jgi:hypothetical protein